MSKKTGWIKFVLVVVGVIILTLLSNSGQFDSRYAQADESSWPYIYYPGAGWRVHTVDGIEGWAVESADGVQTLGHE